MESASVLNSIVLPGLKQIIPFHLTLSTLIAYKSHPLWLTNYYT